MIKKFEEYKDEQYAIFTYEYGEMTVAIELIFKPDRTYSGMLFEDFNNINFDKYRLILFSEEDADRAIVGLTKQYQNRFKFGKIIESEIRMKITTSKYNI